MNEPNIKAADFVDACQRFFRDPAVEAGIIKEESLSPPSPAVLEILAGLHAGWKTNPSVQFIEKLYADSKSQPLTPKTP